MQENVKVLEVVFPGCKVKQEGAMAKVTVKMLGNAHIRKLAELETPVTIKRSGTGLTVFLG